MQQDELAQLFAQSLTLSSHAPTPVEPPAPQVQQFQQVQQPQERQQEQPHEQQQQEQQQQEQPPEQSGTPKPITYASQHYTHSSHIAPKAPTPQPRVHLSPAEFESILLQNGIDPASLFPSQIDLFQNGDDAQRLRLLELWRIAPPSFGGHALANEMPWGETSLEKEEAMAKARYERRMNEGESPQERPRPASAPNLQILAMEDDRMQDGPAAVQAAPGMSDDAGQNAEPYMVSGYEMLAKRDYENQVHALCESHRYNQAIDPVYKAWEKHAMQDMENQYGSFAAMREYGHVHRPVALNGLDEEMVM